MTDKLVVGGQLGNYLIDSVIGRGGMSVVYGAKHARLGMPVAVKVLAPELSSDDTFRERFLREAQIAAGIDHQNVIPINDMGLHDDSLYIVMRYVAGGDLKTLLNSSGPLDTDQALQVLTPVAMALDAAHAHGLVHRDVKPANILLQRSPAGTIEHVYLTDFGIAKSAAFSGGLTGAGASIGTVGYMAPEQLEGREVTAQTDVYALAVTFYECLTGRIPFQRELAEGIHPPVGELEPLSRARPDLPVALDAAIARGLSRDLQSRYPTCHSLLEACRAAIDSQPARSAQLAGDVAASGGDTAVSAVQPTEALSVSPPVAPPIADESSAASVAAPVTARADQEDGGSRGRVRLVGALVAVAVAAVAVVVIILAGSGSNTPKGAPSDAALAEVPTNHVTGSGTATVHLSGDSAAITVTTSGLDNGAELVHLMHIHAGGKGQCPPASAARLHNNHLSISTNDGIN
ncbi:MAG: serine/threonine-protein kinase, partial [Solirubrobacteraceae bacterium]